MNRNELKGLLQQPYDRQTWQGILRNMFRNVAILSSPHAIPCDHKDVESFEEIGSIRLDDGKHLSVFEIKVGEGINLFRNRVELRNLVTRHIDQQTRHGVLVIFDGKTDEYRFTFAARETEFDVQGNFVTRVTATKRYTYLLGPTETCTTPALRFNQLAESDEAKLSDVIEAFSVERLNKEFFDTYKRHYQNFVGHLLSGDTPQKIFGLPTVANDRMQDKVNKPVRDFAKRLLGRIVFLYFLQKKGWLGCPVGKGDWTGGEFDFISRLFAACPDKEKFHSECLVPLFYQALNRPNRPGDIFTITNSRIPYLNGGLFEHELYPVEHIDFPASLFVDLLDFFGQYNFTIDEIDPDDNEVGIDPEMLGHIFENLLEDNKDKGAYYTPKPIVQYMCQQSLLYYLRGKLGDCEELTRLIRYKDAGARDAQDNWVRLHAKEIEELLDKVKICDPAIGSGAFPIGLLQEIYWLKLMLDWTLDPAETKLQIIQNSIYGVDIDAGAVEIARLRFWLALIVDEKQPRPLPNLDYKIMQGDSLLESFEGIPLDSLHEPVRHSVTVFPPQPVNLFSRKTKSRQGSLLGFSKQEALTAKEKAAEITAMTKGYFNETDPLKKQDLHRQIDRFVLDHIDYNLRLAEEKLEAELMQYQTEIADKQKQLKSWKPPKAIEKRMAVLQETIKAFQHKKAKLTELENKPERPYFLWHLFFQNVFAEGGFDIVIANPPYVRQETIKDYKPLLEPHYQCYTGTADLFVYFYERSVNLLKHDGVLTYISSNKYYRSAYGKKLRGFLADNLTMQRMIDFGDAPVFEAIAYASILIGIKARSDVGHSLQGYTWQIGDSLTNVTDVMAASAFAIRQDEMKPDGWRLESPQVIALLAKIRSKGTPLGKYVEGRFFRGVLTGLNEAFVVDRATRDRLIAEDPRSAEVLKPFLRGKDIKRWKANLADQYLIKIESSENAPHPWRGKFSQEAEKIFQQTYPAIYDWLQNFRDALIDRYDQGRYFWELRACVYWKEFDQAKILYPDIYEHQSFCWDTSGSISANTTYFIPTEEKWLTGLFNSSLIEWFYGLISNRIRGGYFRAFSDYIANIPIPSATDIQKGKLANLTDKASSSIGLDLEIIEREINQIIYGLFDLTTTEINLIQSRLSPQETPGGLDNKSALLSRTLPILKQQRAYFSLDTIKRALIASNIKLSDNTLREYMSEAMATGLVGDAGRGWYSRHSKPVALDPKPVARLIRAVAKAFPLLDFCCWSTIQLNPFTQHLLARTTAFLYAESDTLESIADHLRGDGWDVWPNPGKKEALQFIRPGEKTVILRPSIVKQPTGTEHQAPIEKVLVDLKIEAARLQLMDGTEVQRIIDNVLGSGLLQLPVLLGYAEAKREVFESGEMTN